MLAKFMTMHECATRVNESFMSVIGAPFIRLPSADVKKYMVAAGRAYTHLVDVLASDRFLNRLGSFMTIGRDGLRTPSTTISHQQCPITITITITIAIIIIIIIIAIMTMTMRITRDRQYSTNVMSSCGSFHHQLMIMMRIW